MSDTLSNNVTIVTRTYNRPMMLKRALKSVMHQTYSDWKLALINNGGDQEEVLSIVNESGIDRNKIHIIHNKVSQTLGYELNQGFRAIPAKYAAVHDDDDSWHPEFLSKCISHLKSATNPNVKGVVSYVTTIKEKIEDNKIIEIDASEEFNKSISFIFEKSEENGFGSESLRTLGGGAVRLMDMLRFCLFTPVCFVYEQAVFNEIGGYPENITTSEDYVFAINFLANYIIEVIPEYLANYHHRLRQQCGGYTNVTTAESSTLSTCAKELGNQWLIDDLKKGQVGIGVLMGLARQYEIIIQQNDKILSILKKMQSQ